jgi:hypothetical protein
MCRMWGEYNDEAASHVDGHLKMCVGDTEYARGMEEKRTTALNAPKICTGQIRPKARLFH